MKKQMPRAMPDIQLSTPNAPTVRKRYDTRAMPSKPPVNKTSHSTRIAHHSGDRLNQLAPRCLPTKSSATRPTKIVENHTQHQKKSDQDIIGIIHTDSRLSVAHRLLKNPPSDVGVPALKPKLNKPALAALAAPSSLGFKAGFIANPPPKSPANAPIAPWAPAAPQLMHDGDVPPTNWPATFPAAPARPPVAALERANMLPVPNETVLRAPTRLRLQHLQNSLSRYSRGIDG